MPLAPRPDASLASHFLPPSPILKQQLTDSENLQPVEIAQAASSDSKDAGLGIVATILGAITLARAADDDNLAKSILSASLALVTMQDGGAR